MTAFSVAEVDIVDQLRSYLDAYGRSREGLLTVLETIQEEMTAALALRDRLLAYRNEAIVEAIAAGTPQAEVAAKLNLSRALISRIWRAAHLGQTA